MARAAAGGVPGAGDWACLRLRREPLAAVGLHLDRAWARDVLGGAALGTALILLVAGLIALAGGVRFHLDPASGLGALAMGAWAFTWVALLEELLFRGFVFQRLVDGLSRWPALLTMALLFALAHWGNPGMEGPTLAWASIDTVLGALLLGLAYLRTPARWRCRSASTSAGTGPKARCSAST